MGHPAPRDVTCAAATGAATRFLGVLQGLEGRAYWRGRGAAPPGPQRRAAQALRGRRPQSKASITNLNTKAARRAGGRGQRARATHRAGLWDVQRRCECDWWPIPSRPSPRAGARAGSLALLFSAPSGCRPSLRFYNVRHLDVSFCSCPAQTRCHTCCPAHAGQWRHGPPGAAPCPFFTRPSGHCRAGCSARPGDQQPGHRRSTMRLLAGLVLCLAIGASASLYSEGADVLVLTPSNFEALRKPGAAALVEFYAPWLGPLWKPGCSSAGSAVLLWSEQRERCLLGPPAEPPGVCCRRHLRLYRDAAADRTAPCSPLRLSRLPQLLQPTTAALDIAAGAARAAKMPPPGPAGVSPTLASSVFPNPRLTSRPHPSPHTPPAGAATART